MTDRSAHLTSYVRQIADTLSLTTAERRVLQFLVVGFVLGLGVKLTRDLVASPTKFDYSATDSVFIARNSGPEGTDDEVSELSPSGPVHINNATKTELMSLPGVGEIMAERIIHERQDHGAFVSVDDLARVRGIGPKRIEDFRSRVIVD